uniref:Uncharacterized protein n=1 Tax=Octopus bimaculoides TaxID=37653 RepID=A0A0L8HB06_OCTBM
MLMFLLHLLPPVLQHYHQCHFHDPLGSVPPTLSTSPLPPTTTPPFYFQFIMKTWFSNSHSHTHTHIDFIVFIVQVFFSSFLTFIFMQEPLPLTLIIIIIDRKLISDSLRDN